MAVFSEGHIRLVLPRTFATITKTVFLSVFVLAFGVVTAAAAEHTWVGKISDSTCGANHQKGAEHGSKTMSDHD